MEFRSWLLGGSAAAQLVRWVCLGIFVSAAMEHPARADTALPDGPSYEAHLWLGHSKQPDGKSDTGLRFAELAIWPNDNARLFVRYDDGLSRDNSTVAQSERDAAQKLIGGYWHWHPRFATQVDVGRRALPGDINQTDYHLEQLVYLPGNHVLKVGATQGRRNDDRNESLLYVGGGIAVGKGWRFEPTWFYSRNGIPDNHESRWLLVAVGPLGPKWEVAAGVAAGTSHAATTSNDVREGFIRTSYQLNSFTRVHALYRRETVQGSNPLEVLSVGTTFNWR